ncbi:MAG: glycosyltransferase family 4 protein [Limisphaerales bacterium]
MTNKYILNPQMTRIFADKNCHVVCRRGEIPDIFLLNPFATISMRTMASPMNILIIHPENKYVGGAEKMLEYFLTEFVESDCRVTVAVSPGSRMAKLLPPKAIPIWIEPNDSFSLGAFWRQAQTLKRARTEFPFDLIHGWAARDWELASLAGWRCGCPAIGTLHDHPTATYISAKRRRLMRWCANHGLKKIICVSTAVQEACVKAGYSQRKLTTVHNGLPDVANLPAARGESPFRIGFLGAFSEFKGLRDLFQIADELAKINPVPLELHLAGSAQNESGERLLAELRARYESKNWWQHVHWHGWVESPRDFVRTLDLLVMPSREFETFGLVLVEAGQAGVPVLASRVGGVPEIVLEGQTGWLFEPGNVSQAIAILSQMISQPDLARQMGHHAMERIKKEFSATKMVAEYRRIYFNLRTNV